MFKKLLLTLYIGIGFSTIQSCQTEGDYRNKISSKPKLNHGWPHDYSFKKFKIDSSSFAVDVSKDRLNIQLEKSSSFDEQLNKIKKTLTLITKEINLKELRKVDIFPTNNDLLEDISKVEEIQTELTERNGKVNSMGTVSQNAHKSNYLNQITKIFKQLKLEPNDYYIDKCHGFKTQNSDIKYTLRCMSICFVLKPETNMKDTIYQLFEKSIALGDEKYTIEQIESKWIGNEPASEDEIKQAEQRLGINLPKDYIKLLKITNGFPTCSNSIEPSFLKVNQIDFYRNLKYNAIDSWKEIEGLSSVVSDLERAIVIAGLEEEEQQFLLIPPNNINKDWKYWKFALWMPFEEEYQNLNSYFNSVIEFLNEELAK